jgi:anti-anti-sigma factor
MTDEDFKIDLLREPGSVRVQPFGDLDLATVGRVEDQLSELRDSGVRRVVLDLRGLTFMDSTGVSLALRWSLEASRDGFDFALVRGEGMVQRVIELTGIEHHLTFVDPDG